MNNYITMLELRDKVRNPTIYKGKRLRSHAQYMIDLFMKTPVYNPSRDIFYKGKYKFKRKK